MFNPDDPKRKKENREFSPPPQLNLLSLKDKLRFYLIDGAMAPSYGFTLTMTKKLILSDRKTFDRFDSETRSVLLEIYEENKA